MKITINKFSYVRSISPIKMGDYYCTIILDDKGKLKDLLVAKCLDEESVKFNNESQNSFKIISTDNPKYPEIYETD